MGYTKIIQYGNIVEVYEYEKNLVLNRRPYVSAQTKKRTRQILEDRKRKGTYERSPKSIRRSRLNFFRLCHHNNLNANSIHFLTLTFIYDFPYKKATRYVARFMERLKEYQGKVPIRYISVPERTKKGRIHFHILVYNLPPEISLVERKTRNLQRLFERGYVDIVSASYTSQGIAGYMSKYMSKALTDFKNETTRGYNSSRNIIKITSAGSNSLSQFTHMIIPNTPPVQKSTYDVPYLGKCHYKKIVS